MHQDKIDRGNGISTIPCSITYIDSEGIHLEMEEQPSDVYPQFTFSYTVTPVSREDNPRLYEEIVNKLMSGEIKFDEPFECKLQEDGDTCRPVRLTRQ